MVARGLPTDGLNVRAGVHSLDVLAREQLDAGGPWTVHSAFARACNLAGPDGELLGIVEAAGGNAPATLVLDATAAPGPLTGWLSPGDGATREGDVLHLGRQLRLSLAGAEVWTPVQIVRAVPADEIKRRLSLAAELAARSAQVGGLAPLLTDVLTLADGSLDLEHAESAHALVVVRARQLLTDLAAAIREWRWLDTRAPARALSGLGPGLTPAGDDLLAGLALGLRAGPGSLPPMLQTALTDAVVGRTTDLAAARVRHAAAGHPDERTHHLLAALVMDASPDALPVAVAALLAYGHSSGADTLVGLLAGISLGLA